MIRPIHKKSSAMHAFMESFFERPGGYSRFLIMEYSGVRVYIPYLVVLATYEYWILSEFVHSASIIYSNLYMYQPDLYHESEYSSSTIVRNSTAAVKLHV